jgi:cytidyltransferase-like protein
MSKNTAKTIAITSVYANPLHPGHIECFELSKELADELWVIVNNDHQAFLKRGTKSFQSEDIRMSIVASLRPVDRVVLSIDTDPSVQKTLEMLIVEAKEAGHNVLFTKGGDRFANEIPEAVICRKHGVEIRDGLGAKICSSSDFLKNAAPGEQAKIAAAIQELPAKHREQDYIEVGERPWGVYYVLEDNAQFKVKKIFVKPGARLSLQSHERRSEHWVVVDGEACVQIKRIEDPNYIGHQILRKNQSCYVPQGYMHRLANSTDAPLVIIEVQSGDYTGEDDIVRYEDDHGRETIKAEESLKEAA